MRGIDSPVWKTPQRSGLASVQLSSAVVCSGLHFIVLGTVRSDLPSVTASYTQANVLGGTRSCVGGVWFFFTRANFFSLLTRNKLFFSIRQRVTRFPPPRLVQPHFSASFVTLFFTVCGTNFFYHFLLNNLLFSKNKNKTKHSPPHVSSGRPLIAKQKQRYGHFF